MDSTENQPLTHDQESMQNFSATGRPYKPPSKQEKAQYGMNSISVADSWGQGPPNLLPVRYTDDSMISVPVVPPEDQGNEPAPEKKKSFWTSKRKAKNSNFSMKRVSRAEYLKHYAKDDDGKYIGTENPADDCLLRGEDFHKWRTNINNFTNHIEEVPKRVSIFRRKKEKDQDDGVIR